MRLIDADAAIDALKEYFNDEDQKDTEYGAYWHHSHVLKVLESLPTIKPVEQCDGCRYKHIWMTQRMNGINYPGHGGATA